jgi:5-hydroxyisourate hydrolase
MTGVSTHVLDTSRGCPAAGIPVSLDVWAGNGWRRLGASVTGPDGRISDLPGVAGGPPTAGGAQPSTGRLVFAVRGYLEANHGTAFFPEVTVVFAAAPDQDYHLPLLLTPFGYVVYRGS